MNSIEEEVRNELFTIGLNIDEAVISSCVTQAQCELRTAMLYSAVAEYFFIKGDLERLKIWQNKYKREFERVTKMKLSKTTKKTKFLFVEDGATNFEELEQSLAITNPEIKVVCYRQGARELQLQEISQ